MKTLPLAEAVSGCTKPSCTHRAATHRHHRAHEALWFGPFAHRRGEPRWEAFVLRYHEFRSEDVVNICAAHHAEIHAIYDKIIAEDTAGTGLRLYLYSWKQANVLMEKMRLACAEWLLQATPGLDSDIYERSKKLRRGLLQSRAKKKTEPSEGKERLLKERRQRFSRKKRRRKPD